MEPTTPPPLPKPKGGLHVLSWWSLGLNILGVIFFVAGFVFASNRPKHAEAGDAEMAMIFIVAPLCVLGALVTGIIGSVKRKGCLAIGIVLSPVLVVTAMVLFLWLALEAVSAFR